VLHKNMSTQPTDLPRDPHDLRRLADDLSTATTIHDAPRVYPSCGGEEFGRSGADEREVVEYVPSRCKRVVHVCPKISRSACETIVQAPMRMLPIEKGHPSPAPPATF